MELKICCPGCRRNFTLKTDNPVALANSSFKCPKCGMSTPFTTFLRSQGGQRRSVPRPSMPTPPMGGGGMNPMGGGGMNPMKTHLGGASGGFPPPPGGGMMAPGSGFSGTQVHAPTAGFGYLVVQSTGRKIPLTVGEHVLGRQSADSRATIPLAPDPYMSRAHAMLSVSFLSGQIPRITITGMNSQNIVYVNNARLYPGSTIELHPGDELLLGMTTVKYIA